MDASLISCLLCLVMVSVFLHVNFLLKLAMMVITAFAHICVYACYLAQELRDSTVDSPVNQTHLG